MQTVALLNGIRTAFTNAVLRTDDTAVAAADAGICYGKPFLFTAGLADGQALAVDRLFPQIKKFNLACCDTERLQDVTAFTGIDMVHRGVVLENTIDPFFLIRELLDLAVKTDHLEITIHAGNGHLSGLNQLAEEILSTSRTKIERILLHQHDVDDPDLWDSILVHRGKCRTFYLPQQLQTCLCIHMKVSFGMLF